MTGRETEEKKDKKKKKKNKETIATTGEKNKLFQGLRKKKNIKIKQVPDQFVKYTTLKIRTK